jgi:hypothetical protein
MGTTKSLGSKLAGLTAAAVASTFLTMALPAGAVPTPQAPTNAKMLLAPIPDATVGVLASTHVTWDAPTQANLKDYTVNFYTSTGQAVYVGPGLTGSTPDAIGTLPIPVGNSLPQNPQAPTTLTPPFSDGLGVVANYQIPNVAPHGIFPSSPPTFFTLKPVTAMPIFRLTFPWHSSTLYPSEQSSINEIGFLLATFGGSCDLNGAKSINATVTLVGRTNGNIPAERDSALAAARIKTVKTAILGFYGQLGKPVHFRSVNLGDTNQLGDDNTQTWRQADRSVTIELTTTNSPEQTCAG